MPLHDVAIYAPGAGAYYDAAATVTAGGAERQTVLLARSLAEDGLRVAHIVHPVAEPVDTPVTLISHEEPETYGTSTAFARRLWHVWSALNEANPSVVVIRGAQGNVGAAAAWCQVRRRALVFAAANEADFAGGTFDSETDVRARLFHFGMRYVDSIVIQTEVQEAACRARFPRAPVPVHIRSFVEPQPLSEASPEAFLWVSRLADYKRPLLYADLAEAVPEALFWMIAAAPMSGEQEQAQQTLRARAAHIPNLQILTPRPHTELQELVGRAVAMVNTSSYEGMPNTWLEGWSRGIPALTYSFDPDGLVAEHGLGADAGGSMEAFTAAARSLWAGRDDRAELSAKVRDYVEDAHGTAVRAAWRDVIRGLL